MNIALLIGEVGFISHKDLVDGVKDSAVEENDRVFLFTCEGWNESTEIDYYDGENAIFDLPDFSKFDGVIVDTSTIHDEKVKEKLIKRIDEAKIPNVSINIPLNIDLTTVVHLDNRRAIANTVYHLIDKHNISDIHYISGPMHNRDAIARKEAFISAMEERGLEVREDTISYGDFNYHSGQTIIKNYIKNRIQMPQAFVVANDFMAIGVMQELQRANYKIPEDIIVTGYDDMQLAEFVQPRLTTVKRDEYKAGRNAYSGLKKICKERRSLPTLDIYGVNVFSASCGCVHGVRRHKSHLLMQLAEEKIITDHNMDVLKLNSIVISGSKDFSDFSMKIQATVEQLDLDYFYLCIAGNRELYYDEIERLATGEEIERDTTKFMDICTIPLAYEHGVWNSFGVFATSDLLPDNCLMQQAPGYGIVLPVHNGREIVGYCVIGKESMSFDQRFIQHLVLSISNAMGHIKETDIVRTMLAKINKRWLYDELTGVYNRAGLWRMYEEYFIRAKGSNKNLAVIFIDLDGLKQINDNFGHEEGDKYIKSMAEILKNNLEDEIVARYGGDEFVVLSSYSEKKEVEEKKALIEEYIAKFNDVDSSRRLSASIGYQCEEDFDEVDIKEMIEHADKEMYNIKKQRKLSR